jgi:hypothetical protein
MRKEKILIAFTVCVFGISCQKGANEELLSKGPRDNSVHSSVSRLSYGEKTFFVDQNNGDKNISPISTPDVEGHFTSIPAGLALNRISGVINLEKSQSGQPYKIFYVNKRGVLIDSFRIVISGLDYVDGIYNSKEVKSKFGQKANAIYSGDESKPIPSNFLNSFVASVNDKDDDSGDVTGLSINPRDGSLDLKRSMDEGFFGKSPGNGAYKELVVKYRLGDKSGRKLNKQKIRLFYFENESRIPESLHSILKDRKRIMDRVNSMPLPGHSGVSQGEDCFEDDLQSFNKPARPPLIIVT